MEREAQWLNEKYAKFVTTGRPFAHLKTACSLDGRIATRAGDAQWITGDEARAASQSLRHDYDAILIGVGTVLADDPLLSDRTPQLRHRPLTRVVLDATLRTPLSSQLVRTARDLPLIIFTAEPQKKRGADNAAVKQQVLEQSGATVVPTSASDGRIDLASALDELGRRELTSLIVEGGAEVSASFIEQRLVDKVTFFIAPKIIGGREAIPAIGGLGCERLSEALELRDLEVVRRGDDWEVTGYPKAVMRDG
jgi:diaminohydroxyphosphoribosylaminopyrimidine deaminase/5-amino-6-(5-phosphoribosylamino)uracil reductase